MKKKFLAVALIFAIAAALCPKIATPVVAAESDFVISGSTLTTYNGPGGDVVIPNGVSMIGSRAFENNTQLTSVVIPGSVQIIDFAAFNGCTNLASVTFSDGLQNILSEAFQDCTSLSSLTIPDSVQSIDDYAFYNCTALTSVVLPANLEHLGSRAFLECRSLIDVTIPDSLTEIEGEAFHRTPWLESLGKFAVVNNILIAYQGTDTSVVIPAGITTIAGKAFSENKALTGVTIPEGVMSIGSYAFDHCTNLTNVTISDSVTAIENGAFRDTPWLAQQGEFAMTDSGLLFAYQGTGGDVVIPDGVTALSDRLFSVSKNITSVTIPDGVVSIGEHAFRGCTNLVEVTIPDSVTSIGGWAFYNCTSLTSISIPSGVTSLEYAVFGNCHSLTHINLPSRLKSIEDNAFLWCGSLSDLTILDDVTSIGRNALYGLPDGAIVHGVAGSFAEGHIKENYPNLVFVADQPAGLIFRTFFGPHDELEVLYQADRTLSITGGAIPAGHKVFVACYDAGYAFLGAKLLTAQTTRTVLPAETDSICLIWLNEALVPQCLSSWIQA